MENNQNNNEKQGKGKHYLIHNEYRPQSVRYLVVVDMQKDFIDGSLGTEEAQGIVEKVKEKILSYPKEGKMLPVPQCIKGTEGWGLHPILKDLILPDHFFEKGSFGSLRLAESMRELFKQQENIEGASIELVGLCTDICVVSNALLLKAFLPEVPISVDSSCCAGVTREKHLAALETLRSCQVEVS